MLLLRVREQTIDIDLKLDPEPEGAFEAIAELKDRLAINVELAAPDDFVPALPGWKDRSEFIKRIGSVEFRHYDFYGQVLSKLARAHARDAGDVEALVRIGKVDRTHLGDLFSQVRPQLIRYPALDAAGLESRIAEFEKA